MRCLRDSAWGSKDSIVARLCAGQSAFTLSGIVLFCWQKRTRKPPAISTRWIHEKGAARPFQTPKGLSKRKKASRCAKTGCGAQRPLRALSGTRVLLTAAPTAPPCIRRRRRSSLLHFFLVSPIYGFAEDFMLQIEESMNHLGDYDVIVNGAGHAGIEAAHAAAMLGAKTAVFTMSLDAIGNMPCNPSIGGTAKGTLVLSLIHI